MGLSPSHMPLCDRQWVCLSHFRACSEALLPTRAALLCYSGEVHVVREGQGQLFLVLVLKPLRGRDNSVQSYPLVFQELTMAVDLDKTLGSRPGSDGSVASNVSAGHSYP